jgi:alkylation response protein AidB-like acyl-CoA dehydrogenase
MTDQEPTRYEETREQRDLRGAVATLGARYGWDYFRRCAREGRRTQELWAEAGRAGFLGVAVPEEFGGGGGGISELAIVCEELARAGCPLLLTVVSPAICGTVISRFGTPEQRKRWLPGFADGSLTMAFAITEPEAGSNSHRLATLARRDGDNWVLSGRKIWISGVDGADALLVVARLADDPRPGGQGRLRPALFVVPVGSAGLSHRRIEMELVSPEGQFEVLLDEVRLPADHLVGEPDAGLPVLFAGLNPERILVAAFCNGISRFALQRATTYAGQRRVWDVPIGAHQAVAHPLAAAHVEVELARLMERRASALYDAGRDAQAGEAANLAKYAAGEAVARTVDAAVQAHGGAGLAVEYGVGALLGLSRVARIAPVSREMLLNYVAQHSLGLPRSY